MVRLNLFVRALARTLFTLLLGLAWTEAAIGLVVAFLPPPYRPERITLALATAAAIPLMVALAARRWSLRACFEVLVLLVLPPWGWFINHGLPTCETCDSGSTDYRLLSEPGIYGLFLAYWASVGTYGYSRFRPGLSVRLEPWVLAALLAGVVLLAPVVVQFGGLAVAGLIFGFVGFPLVAPIAVIVLYSVELFRRFWWRPLDEGQSRRALRPVLGRSGLLLGLYAAAQALIARDPAGAVQVFTQTCGATLSQLHPLPCPEGYHYLCTVAARGHPWLVRPLRVGRRRGAPILVNRQLAVANAFEDLLHERWPRFGALARRTYDTLGLPVSRWIRWCWAADLVYLAMKPAEIGFYLFMRMVDRSDPEQRIGRMYR